MHKKDGCMGKKVFAFDLGKASIGFCVREGHEIKEVNSLIIEREHADISGIRDRRHAKRILSAHKAREKYFIKLWKDCGLEPLDTADEKFKREFACPNDDTVYTSCLLRIALLQNKKLEEWQIFKAIYNAVQRRGYDVNLPWKSVKTDDDKKNIELSQKYAFDSGVELIKSDEYKYPCYYDALRLGLWEETKSNEFKRHIPFENDNKVRAAGYVAPRCMVEKELSRLWINAQSQIPALKKYSVEEFLYGEYREAYGSYVNSDYQKYMGKERDWQGVLGQKIPRFHNRIVFKCKLLPKRNVCKAETIENASFVLLMKLKNLRITDINGEKVKLNADEIKKIYENWLSKVKKNNGRLDITITKSDIKDVTGRKIIDKIEPLKVHISGRSSFCRRACKIMSKVILTGANPLDMDILEFIDPDNCRDGITEEEIRTMLSKVGNWDNLYIPDNRNEIVQSIDYTRSETDIMIGNITNPVVRNRLQIFRDLLYNLSVKYGKPDEVIFEFIRNGADNSLFGRVKAQAFKNSIEHHEKENKLIKKELDDVGAYSKTNFEKFKLLKMQCGRDIYSGDLLGISDFDRCDVDHIYPKGADGNDAFYNKVLCLRIENNQKGKRTPYEWLSGNEDVWANYVNRLNEIKNSLGKKKYELLTNKPEDCKKLIEKYNALAETGYVARIAQQMTALMFGWGLQVDGQKQHIYVNNGSLTAAIRRRYGLNSLLGNDIEKNRDNDKHHALDAVCISYSRDFKYNEISDDYIIEGFNVETVKKAIDAIVPYPYVNKKPLKGNTRPLETIYSLRQYNGKAYITNRVALTSIESKTAKVKTILDEVIKNDLLSKIDEQMAPIEWKNMLQNYIHPTKKTHVKKVTVIVSEGQLEKDANGYERLGEFYDFGHNGTRHQFKHSKGHKGQILYYNEKGVIKVMPIYSNIKTADAKEKLLKLGCKLYNKGQMFYSGCLVKIPNEFKAGKQICPAGIYKIRTIKSAGDVKLENSCGTELHTSAAYLAKAKFQKV